VINAQKPHISETASNDEAEKNKHKRRCQIRLDNRLGSKGSTVETQQQLLSKIQLMFPTRMHLNRILPADRLKKTANRR
jgi:hypothetical protein